MAKSMKVMIEIHEAAVGRVLSSLSSMPGIAMIDLNLQQFQRKPKVTEAHAPSKGDPPRPRHLVLAFLAEGKRTSPEVSALLAEAGIKKSAKENTIYLLKKEGLITSKRLSDGKMQYGLTAQGRSAINNKI